MDKQKAKTGAELFKEIDADSVAEKAEDKFHANNIKRVRLSERIAHFMPLAVVVVWLASYILSSPFTVGFFGRITPDIIWGFGENTVNLHWIVTNISPLTLEGFMLILSAVLEYRKDENNRLLITLIGSMWFLSTMVNVVGGIDKLLMTPEITYIDIGWLVLAVIAGFLVSTISLYSGRLLTQLSSGEVKMEIDSSKLWQGTIKYNALKRAFENAASELTRPSTASKYALIMAKRYSEVIEVIEDTVDAIGNTQLQGQVIGSRASVQTVQQSESVPTEFGFSAMATRQTQVLYSGDNQNTQTTQTVHIVGRPSVKKVIQWIEDNPTAWQQWNVGDTKRARASNIALALCGKVRGYKTVERAFKAMEIEL